MYMKENADYYYNQAYFVEDCKEIYKMICNI